MYLACSDFQLEKINLVKKAKINLKKCKNPVTFTKQLQAVQKVKINNKNTQH